jgi:methylated-DNA-[protein]-cysteine S-methyltransferase
MNYGKKISSPIGNLYLIANDHALIALDNISNDLYKNAAKSETHKILNLTHKQLDEYFLGKRFEFNLPLEPLGTPFQQKAWKALSKIPYGKVWSYGEQAIFLKSPKACRAVGGANGKNPIPIIIPCHRVIGSTGKLTGYSGGMKMKIGLLKHEGHQIDGLQLIKI